MLVLKIEMWPKGDASKAREIGRTYIYNNGGSLTRGNYVVRVCRKNRFEKTPHELGTDKGFTRVGEVKDYPRLDYNVWRLVIRSLRSAFPEEG